MQLVINRTNKLQSSEHGLLHILYLYYSVFTALVSMYTLPLFYSYTINCVQIHAQPLNDFYKATVRCPGMNDGSASVRVSVTDSVGFDRDRDFSV